MAQLPDTIVLCSFNVHSFSKPSGDESVTDFLALLLHHRPHVLCLQEFNRSAQVVTHASASSPRALQPLLDTANAQFAGQKPLLLPWLGAIMAVLHNQPYEPNAHHLSWASLAIIAAFPVVRRPTNLLPKSRKRETSVARGGLSDRILAACCMGLEVVNVHLDHVAAATRQQQLDRYFALHLDPRVAQVWVGDWNALTRADYTTKQWANIAAVRARNSWEPPRTSVMTHAKKVGLDDAASLASAVPLPTSRFATRIDYVLLNTVAQAAWTVECYRTLTEVELSDHKPVIAQLQRL